MKAKSRVCGPVLRGPLGSFRDSFRTELVARGYAAGSVDHQLRQAARLSLWLQERALLVDELDERRVEEFLIDQRLVGRFRAEWSRAGLRCLLQVLREQGVAAVGGPAVPVSGVEALLSAFGAYLLAERGLAASTVSGYVARVREFLLGLDGGELAALTPREVTAAVLVQAGRGQAVSSSQKFVAAVRAFLRYCFVEGLVGTDLTEAALAVTGRRRSPLPRGISSAQARALLASCDRRTALGRRDHAIIVSLLRLGLRRSELARVTLEDLDWRAGEVAICGKAGRVERLPLPADVGAAIAGYLRRGRPVSPYREVFLRARAPFTPIDGATVSSTVRRACGRAGIASMGAHRLRHTLACQMVAAGVPLIQIGQVLRHKSLQSTAIYARVDVERLRELAVPWPIGAPR